MNVSEPWSTQKLDAAFRKWVRDQHRRCREQNPALMRRLRKLSDNELLRLEIAFLERAPATPQRTCALRVASGLLALRLAPKPPIKRYRLSPHPEQRPTPPLQRALGGLGGELPAHELPPPAPTAAPAEARPKPCASPPDNVIRPYFGPKAFGIGGKSFWIGGEV
jgi:hypothetical protein